MDASLIGVHDQEIAFVGCAANDADRSKAPVARANGVGELAHVVSSRIEEIEPPSAADDE